MNNEKETLLRSRVLFGALAMGQFVFLIVIAVISKEIIPIDGTTPESWLYPAGALLLGVVLWFLYRLQLKKALSLSSREARLNAWQAVTIFRFVAVESGTLLLIVSFMLTQQFALLICAGIWFIVFLALFPTASRFEIFLNGGRAQFDR